MKKYFIFTISFYLSSCIGYIPQYHDREQAVSIYNLQVTNDVKAYLDEKPIEISFLSCDGRDFNRCDSGEKDIKHKNKSSPAIEGVPQVIIERLPKERELRLKRSGYEDQVFILKYKLTDDKWAHGKAEYITSGEKSAAILLLPTNTYKMVSIFGEGFVGTITDGDKYVAGITVVSFLAIPLAVVGDVVNIVIGLPSTAIVNPWFEYKIENNPAEQIREWKKE